MTTRLVLFDLDGTLVDHESAAAAAVAAWLTGAELASAADLPALVVEWSALTERHFGAFLVGTTTYQGQRRRRLREFLPLVGVDAGGWTDDRLDETFAVYAAAYRDAWAAYPDVVPCLTSLRRTAVVAVLSNGEQAQQSDKVARTGLGPHVDAVLTAELLGAAKPDPAIFLAACKHFGVPPRDAAYVGDLLDTDAVAANVAGLRGVWLDRADAGGPPDAERVTTLADLPALLARTGDAGG